MNVPVTDLNSLSLLDFNIYFCFSGILPTTFCVPRLLPAGVWAELQQHEGWISVPRHAWYLHSGLLLSRWFSAQWRQVCEAQRVPWLWVRRTVSVYCSLSLLHIHHSYKWICEGCYESESCYSVLKGSDRGVLLSGLLNFWILYCWVQVSTSTSKGSDRGVLLSGLLNFWILYCWVQVFRTEYKTSEAESVSALRWNGAVTLSKLGQLERAYVSHLIDSVNIVLLQNTRWWVTSGGSVILGIVHVLEVVWTFIFRIGVILLGRFT
jgi:hypothetical protein